MVHLEEICKDAQSLFSFRYVQVLGHWQDQQQNNAVIGKFSIPCCHVVVYSPKISGEGSVHAFGSMYCVVIWYAILDAISSFQ